MHRNSQYLKDVQTEDLLLGQLHWHGTCVHDFRTPRWVQKQRQVDSDDSGSRKYQEPKRATTVAINSKFSLIAIGTHG